MRNFATAYCNVKGAWSDFSDWILFNWIIIKQQNLGLKFQLNQSNRLETRKGYVFMLILHCVRLITVTITTSSHIFINIFQTVHFSAVKFTSGNEKNMSFLLIPKSQKGWKKSEAIEPGSSKSHHVSRMRMNLIFRTFPKNRQECLKTSRKWTEWGTKISRNQEISWQFSCLM